MVTAVGIAPTTGGGGSGDGGEGGGGAVHVVAGEELEVEGDKEGMEPAVKPAGKKRKTKQAGGVPDVVDMSVGAATGTGVGGIIKPEQQVITQ